MCKQRISVEKEGNILLEIKNLTVRYGGAIALHNLTVQFESGKVAAIIGPNGAGKTTLLNAISGLIPFDGSINFNSINLNNKRPEIIVRLGIIQCPQSGGLFPELTVLENLMLGAYSRKKIIIDDELERVFELFRALKNRINQRAGTLSGGERQMVAIGRSLMANPSLLLLDEPTLGLAPAIRDVVEDSIRKIISTVPVIIVEQDAGFALDLADTVCILASGELVIQSTPEELMKNNLLKSAYLGIV